MAVFIGVGLVNSKGKRLALFVDGKFETNNEKTIMKLTELGFKQEEIKEEKPVKVKKEKKAKKEKLSV